MSNVSVDVFAERPHAKSCRSQYTRTPTHLRNLLHCLLPACPSLLPISPPHLHCSLPHLHLRYLNTPFLPPSPSFPLTLPLTYLPSLPTLLPSLLTTLYSQRDLETDLLCEGDTPLGLADAPCCCCCILHSWEQLGAAIQLQLYMQ